MPARKATLDGYARAIEVAAEQSSEPPILVAHSMGGMPATLAAARSPGLFSALIYIAAFVPLRNDSLFTLFWADRRSLLRGAMRSGLFAVTVERNAAGAIFFGECHEADVRWASGQLRPDPIRPTLARLRIEPDTELPRYYIECTKDQAISVDAQRAMCGRAGIDHVISMETDHSPFLSTPAALAGHLGRLADVRPVRC